MSTPWKRKEIIGDCTLYLGDCMEVMPTLGKVDAVVTDPPYGINYDAAAASVSGKQSGKGFGKKGVYKKTDWDSKTFPDEINYALSIARKSIVFGGNYYELPPSKCWLVWDKENNGGFADCELAWSNIDKPVRLIRHMWNGGIRKGQEPRNNHPTQKPVGVMEWCIGHLPDNTETILDPFMGSGTTLVACAKLGRSGIGIELDEDYFNIACERVEKAYSQADLFVAPPENKDIKRNQVSMFDDGDAA